MKCEHRWPKHGGDTSIRSIGSHEKMQCMNCLAIKIIHRWSTWRDPQGKEIRTKHESVSIIEDPR